MLSAVSDRISSQRGTPTRLLRVNVSHCIPPEAKTYFSNIPPIPSIASKATFSSSHPGPQLGRVECRRTAGISQHASDDAHEHAQRSYPRPLVLAGAIPRRWGDRGVAGAASCIHELGRRRSGAWALGRQGDWTWAGLGVCAGGHARRALTDCEKLKTRRSCTGDMFSAEHWYWRVIDNGAAPSGSLFPGFPIFQCWWWHICFHCPHVSSTFRPEPRR